MRKIPKNKLYDMMHRGVVWACVGLTLYGTIHSSILGYDYFFRVKPDLEKKREEHKIELLKEGSIDNAPTIKL